MVVQPSGAEATRVGVRELRGNLTSYLRRAAAGGTILVTSNDAVIAEIHAPSLANLPRRQPGALRGAIQVADDFNTLPEAILQAMER